MSIPVTNTSVNPARSLGVAWFAGGAALAQVWLFIVAPIIGAVIAGVSYAAITGANRARSTRASPTTRNAADWWSFAPGTPGLGDHLVAHLGDPQPA